MATERRTTELLVIDDFRGYVADSTGPLGSVTDVGEHHTPYRSRGFQINNRGKMMKSRGYSHVAQIFEADATLDITQIHGMHFWKGASSGSTIILAGTFGFARSRAKSESAGTDPYMLRFEAISQISMDPSWASQPAAESSAGTNDGSFFLFGDFAEFRDRLYYCNGVDWPIRIDGLHSLFARAAVKSPEYSPMGVVFPSLAGYVVFGRVRYGGFWDDGGGVNKFASGSYVATVASKFGEGVGTALATAVNPGFGSGDYSHTLAYVDSWSDFPSDITEIRIYRYPHGGSYAQYVGKIVRPDETFLDLVPDGELGEALPYSLGHPSRFRLLCTFEDRMFAVGGYGNPNRLVCSVAGFPDMWPSTYEINLSSGLSTQMITRLAVVNGDLHVFLEEAILRMVGTSPENYSFTAVSDFVGCVAPKTLFPWQDGVIFLSRSGLYFFNGSTLRNVSEPLSGILDTEATGSMLWHRACGAVNGDYYYLSYRDDSGRKWLDASTDPRSGYEPNRTYVINMNTGRVGVIDDWAFSLSSPYEGSESLVLGHNVYQCYLSSEDEDASFDGSTIAFGNQATGTDTDFDLVVTNKGSSMIYLNASVTGACFTLNSGSGEQYIAPGGTHTLQVRFSPVAQQAYAGTLDTGAPSCGATIALTGTGVAP